MQIEEKKFGDVIVLSLKGKMTLGEGDEALKDKINELVLRNELQIVLHLEGVPYIDSAGNGEIVRTYTTVSRQGGRLVLCGLTKRIEDLLAIEKLLTVFETYAHIEEAVATFSTAGVDATCPVCRPERWITLRGPASSSLMPGLFCPECQTSALFADRKPDRALVRELSVPTYPDEHVRVQLGVPCTITVQGRLDLFAFEVIGKIWELLPLPRRVVFSLGYGLRSFTPHGLAKVLELCETWTDESRAAVEARFASPELKLALSNSGRVLEDGKAPGPELRDLTEAPAIAVAVRKASGHV